jgi:hypothetical protein
MDAVISPLKAILFVAAGGAVGGAAASPITGLVAARNVR